MLVYRLNLFRTAYKSYLTVSPQCYVKRESCVEQGKERKILNIKVQLVEE